MSSLKKKKPTIALLFGGRSAEHDVSLSSAKAIYSNLDPNKYRVVSIYINLKGEWRVVESPHLPLSKMRKGPVASFLPWDSRCGAGGTVRADIYFPVLHGPYGEDGTIQGLLEMADVPYVGAGVTASAVGMDKVIMKTLFAAAGLPIVPYLAVKEPEWRRHRASVLSKVVKTLPFPIFVKPSNLGSSVGISKVKSRGTLVRACELAFTYDETILIEQGIEGQELECSVLGNRTAKASIPGELIPYREFYDYEDKYLYGKTQFRIPAEVPARTATTVRRLSVAAFQAIGCSGLARVDFFVEGRTGRVFVNEINTIPGFTEISMYPRLWAVSGIGFPALVEELIRLGFERHRSKKRRVERRPA
jgi:D-alanine-D-alanine ligase